MSILFLLGLTVMVSSCTKDVGVCLSSTGQVIREIRTLPVFTKIDMQDNISLVLIQDTVCRVEVEAGQKIISGIRTEVIDGQLILQNFNQCNWLRDYSKPINVYVYSDTLWKITYNSSGDITSNGTLKMDSLKVIVWGGCGTIDLTLDIWQGSFSLNMGTVDIRLHGVCAVNSVFTGDYGMFDGRDLRTGYTFITNKGSNDSYIQATNEIDATILSIGNIYYRGNPCNIKSKILGSGQLLPF
ncbi:MAG: DUF2807 domain-containing protein [Bacteroidales bacterium]|nr:DUF2807 domain-containing protein [Bacteroidales bacterium]